MAVIRRSLGSNTQDAESMFQHIRVYFVVAFAILFFLIALRIIVLRARNQSLSNFFRMGTNIPYSYGSYPPHESNYGSMYHGLQLSPVPAAYHPDRRMRAADLDLQGRRLSPAGEQWEGKESLPAYDNLDRPPKYLEAGWSQGGPSPATEQPATTSSPEGEQNGRDHPSTTNGVSRNNVDPTSEHTFAAAGAVHGDEAPLPPTHDEMSSS